MRAFAARSSKALSMVEAAALFGILLEAREPGVGNTATGATRLGFRLTDKIVVGLAAAAAPEETVPNGVDEYRPLFEEETVPAPASLRERIEERIELGFEPSVGLEETSEAGVVAFEPGKENVGNVEPIPAGSVDDEDEDNDEDDEDNSSDGTSFVAGVENAAKVGKFVEAGGKEEEEE